MSFSYLWTRGFSDFWALMWVSLWSLCSKILSPTFFCEATIQSLIFNPCFFVENSGTHDTQTQPTETEAMLRQNRALGLHLYRRQVWRCSALGGSSGSRPHRGVPAGGGWFGWRLVGWMVDFGKGVLDWDRTLVAVVFFFFWGGTLNFTFETKDVSSFKLQIFFVNNCSCILPLKGAKSWQVVSISIKCSKGGVIIMLVFGCRGWTFLTLGGYFCWTDLAAGCTDVGDLS